jgi:transcriptional regulator with XRE-family HTH domain
MNISTRIDKLLKDKGMSPSDFCNESGFDSGTLSRLLTGKTKRPNTDNLKTIAEYFHVPVKWLKYGDDLPQTPPTPSLPAPGDDIGNTPEYASLNNDQRIDRLLSQNDRLINILEKRDERIMAILETQVSTINNLSQKMNDPKNAQAEAS